MKYKEEILMTLFIVAVIAIITNEYLSCDGSLVRGLFWFECISEVK